MAKKGFLKKYGAWAPVVVGVGAIFVIVAAVVIPYVFIWALNELFSLNIPFNFYTWLAALIIIGLVAPKGR
jgi:hypothetical protein